jgi:hypothetical protein
MEHPRCGEERERRAAGWAIGRKGLNAENLPSPTSLGKNILLTFPFRTRHEVERRRFLSPSFRKNRERMGYRQPTFRLLILRTDFSFWYLSGRFPWVGRFIQDEKIQIHI